MNWRWRVSPSTEPDEAVLPGWALPSWQPPSRRMVFVSGLLFLATFLSSLFVGLLHMVAFAPPPEAVTPNGTVSVWWMLSRHPEKIWLGLPYAATLILILLSHEMGHYLYCWYYRVNATLPVFLPAPTLIGTFGAFIRIRGIIPHRNALLDIGFTGPFIGFLVCLPFLALGIHLSRAVSATEEDIAGSIVFGEPLIWKLLATVLRDDPPDAALVIHPIALAAWFGLLATNLNLFPIGQLDGGHVTYAVFGRRARWISLACWLGLVALAFHNYVWIAWTVLTFFIGFRHPPTLWDHVPLDPRRRWMAGLAWLMFILTFMPDPIRILP